MTGSGGVGGATVAPSDGEVADAVVVGGGHNGLVAANLLADAGWSVHVLEGADAAGGAVRTEEITAPGWRNDLGSAFYPMGRASPVLTELGLEDFGLRWRHAPHPMAHVLPDDRGVLLSRDVEETAASVDRFSPGDGDAWRALVEQWRRLREPLLETILRPFPPVRGATRLVRASSTAELLRLARRLVMPVGRFVSEEFGGEGARVLLAGNALHTDLGADAAGSAVYGWLLSMLAQDVGFPVPSGGAGRITDALCARLASRGGRLDVARPVARVLVEGGRATGVVDTAGGVVRARRAVLADVAAPLLYRRLVGDEHLPPRMVADLDRFQWDDAVLKVDWALSGPVPWLAPEARGAGTVHLGGDLAGLRDFAADVAAGRTPQVPFMLVGQMTTADPARSPAGTESLWAYTHLPHGQARTDADVAAQVESMSALFERHAPGFSDLVVARSVSSPTTLERRDASLVEGAVMGGTASIHQQLFLRPVPGLGRADTPVDRLFLAGASAHPGGAVHGGPGANAARAALARSGRLGAGYAAAVRAGHRLVYG